MTDHANHATDHMAAHRAAVDRIATITALVYLIRQRNLKSVNAFLDVLITEVGKLPADVAAVASTKFDRGWEIEREDWCARLGIPVQHPADAYPTPGEERDAVKTTVEAVIGKKPRGHLRAVPDADDGD